MSVWRWRRVTLAGVLAALTLGPAVAAGQPLPDPEAFKQAVRERLVADRDLLSQYMYLEQREEIEVSRLGKVQTGPVKVYEVYPSADRGNTWKRLIAVNGEPLPPDELKRNDRKHRDDLRKRRRESAAERQKRAREQAEAIEEERAIIDDLFRVYDIRLVRREYVDGHPTIYVTLDPKPESDPQTEHGEAMKKVRVQAWVHEHDHQVVRAVFEVVQDITWVWGLVGRIHAGSRAEYAREKVNGEVWLPAALHIDASGRSLMFRTFDLDASTKWWGYRRHNGHTIETMAIED